MMHELLTDEAAPATSKEITRGTDSLPENFFRKIGTAKEFFDSDVQTVLYDYLADPEGVSPMCELLLLKKMDSALTFDTPGLADQFDVYRFADAVRRIARSGDDDTEPFHFKSELGRQYARYIDEADSYAHWDAEFSGGLKFPVSYDFDMNGFGIDKRSPDDPVGAMTTSTPSGIRAHEDLFGSDSFRSFLSNMTQTGKKHIPEGVSTGLFIRWLAHIPPKKYEQHAAVIQRYEGDKTAFLEAFLAMEFGDDFGDTILSLAEHATPEQSAKIFEMINSYRAETKNFADMYTAYDGELAEQTEQAMNERLADLLAVAEHVARMGNVTVDTAPHRDRLDYEHDGRFDITVKSVDQVAEIMEHLLTTFRLRREIVDAEDTQVSKVVQNEDDSGYQIYRFRNEILGDALLHVRPEGSGRYDKAFEYGNYDGVEATVSWVVNPTGDHRLTSDKDPRGVSIRYDREGRAEGEAPDSSERSSVRADGMISIDISSGLGNAKSIPVQIGRMIAAGNILRAKEQGTKVSLHHNTNGFDHEKFASAKGFEKIARYMQTMAEARIKMQRSRKVARRVTSATVSSPPR